MSIFVILKDQILSMPSVLGQSTNSAVSSLDSSIRVLR